MRGKTMTPREDFFYFRFYSGAGLKRRKKRKNWVGLGWGGP